MTRGGFGCGSVVAMSVIVTENVDHARVIRLNRPERKNALTSELGWRLVTALRDAAAEDSVRCIAVTGNGDAFFSGPDLADSDGSAVDSGLSQQAEASDHLGWLGRFRLTIRWDCDKPVIMGQWFSGNHEFSVVRGV
ncbi:MAG TPA: enoyl-CoA hydratase-related protein [Acidimicrobiales bacterium]|nr:enoyl-CoA hydratase-related protein [Acidimicrobiales bacterium]